MVARAVAQGHTEAVDLGHVDVQPQVVEPQRRVEGLRRHDGEPLRVSPDRHPLRAEDDPPVGRYAELFPQLEGLEFLEPCTFRQLAGLSLAYVSRDAGDTEQLD